ncbi:D-glycero-beta-D-manno-heptose 1-phosphate adenylyltransferase [Allokutzneria albata]|uniref:D-glycero-beta-D-manno-heptose 1-phosphate adenylyltransferase n=1 Tax=Allokutzneria albata TaxID=211114 RepID=A0A1G9UH22_ALLAB|nr:D-glycero-beta-D-manno-heptose 1-phosphate adenylyltransferase [Allokutzneria albata]SDM59074.1 rfaE bifunctional protein, domain I/rfaE bifunctional protein, domain II [Allokutzneria albata]
MNLVVVGDTLLDVDLVGTVNRICPDAPAPVLDLADRNYRPGGAGLAALLAARDGTNVTLVTALAEDDAGQRLRDELRALNVVAGPSRTQTSVKTRVRCAGQSLARIDEGAPGAAPSATDEMLEAVRGADAVLVSDYGRGLLWDRRLRSTLTEVAGRVPVVWDPHPRGPEPIPGATMVTPNASEADLSDPGVTAAHRAARRLRDRWSVRAVAVTLGSAGAVLDQGGLPLAVPAPSVPVFDPCGAGDRFAVTVATRLLVGATPEEAVTSAVSAAARFLADGGASSVGATPVSVVDSNDALRRAEEVRARGGTVVATGGCFDLLHAGHTRTLAAARALGDCLIVCMNSDDSVRRLKGPDRPINPERERAELLESLTCVDAVAVFDEDTPESIVDMIRPDIWVKGGDYRAEDLPEAALLSKWGGCAVAVPYHPGHSTTRLALALAEAG